MSASAKPMLVLASASPRRRELLRLAGVPFRVQPSAADERPEPGESPEEFARRAARLKAEAVGVLCPRGSWVLAADTIVVVDGNILGKPRDNAEAAEMLRLLSGRSHRVLTAVNLRQANGDESESCELLAETTVWFRPLGAKDIEWYLATGEPLDKAGAYGIQGHGALLVGSIEGSYTNVVGLPLVETVAMLEEAGVWP